MVKGMYCRMDFLNKNTRPYYWKTSFCLPWAHSREVHHPFLGKVFLGSAQVLSVDYRKDDFNEIVLYNECSLYLVGEDTLTVGYWCPPLIWGGMKFLLRRYTHELE